LNALPSYVSILAPAAPQRFSRAVRFGILSPHTDRACGPARFSVGLSGALSAQGADADVICAADGQPCPSSRVIPQLVNGSASSVAECKDLLNRVDVAVIQNWHGVSVDEVVDIVDGLRVPSIVIADKIPKDPTSQERSVLEAIAAMADHVVVMSEAARQRLCLDYAVDRRKVTAIPHGAHVPSTPRMKRPSRPIILTWGWLRPGKGIERVIDAIPRSTMCPVDPVMSSPARPIPRPWQLTARRTAMPVSNRLAAAAWRIQCPSTPATTTGPC
jgi:polysaccharide biosynthesis protein PslF